MYKIIGNRMVKDIQKHFEKERYVVIREFLSQEMCTILYRYFIMHSEATRYKMEKSPDKYDKEWDGKFGDSFGEHSFAYYGDPLGDSILEMMLPDMESFTGKTLLPNYSYWRLYYTNAELHKHTDRPSCEISSTICLGYDISNLAGNYSWPINLRKFRSDDEVSVILNPGDMLVYRGCDLSHWRDAFKGINHAQMFLHFTDANGRYKEELFDGRDLLGVASGLN